MNSPGWRGRDRVRKEIAREFVLRSRTERQRLEVRRQMKGGIMEIIVIL